MLQLTRDGFLDCIFVLGHTEVSADFPLVYVVVCGKANEKWICIVLRHLVVISIGVVLALQLILHLVGIGAQRKLVSKFATLS